MHPANVPWHHVSVPRAPLISLTKDITDHLGLDPLVTVNNMTQISSTADPSALPMPAVKNRPVRAYQRTFLKSANAARNMALVISLSAPAPLKARTAMFGRVMAHIIPTPCNTRNKPWTYKLNL